MKKIFLSLFLLFLFSAPAQADFLPSCESLEKHNESTENKQLTELIQKQTNDFFKASQLLETFNKCDDKSIKKYQEIANTMTEELFFGIKSFLGSSAAFYNNTCQQKDSEKLLMLIDTFEQHIFDQVQNCKNVEPLIKIKNETAQFMTYIRDKDNSLAGNTIQNKSFAYYWDEKLYASNSLSCPTENWKAVAQEWCDLQENWKNFQSTTKKLISLEDQTKKEKADRAQTEAQIKAQAKSDAETYLRANLPDFLSLKDEKTDAKASNEKDGVINTLLAPIINSYENLESKLYTSSNTQNIFTTQDAHTKDSIKLLELEAILSDISNNYGKSATAQLYLEKEIYEISQSVKNTTDKQIKHNLYAFTKTLKKTENTNGLQCSISTSL